jgi:hypothetical protein
MCVIIAGAGYIIGIPKATVNITELEIAEEILR